GTRDRDAGQEPDADVQPWWQPARQKSVRRPQPVAKGIAGSDRGRAGTLKFEKLIRRHPGAHLRAQGVDRDEALGGVNMPEGPAVAGVEALRQRADAVD